MKYNIQLTWIDHPAQKITYIGIDMKDCQVKHYTGYIYQKQAKQIFTLQEARYFFIRTKKHFNSSCFLDKIQILPVK